MQFIKNLFKSVMLEIDRVESEIRARDAAKIAKEERARDPDYRFYKWILSIPIVEWMQIRRLIAIHHINEEELLAGLYSVHSLNVRFQDMADGRRAIRDEEEKANTDSVLVQLQDASATKNLANLPAIIDEALAKHR